MEKMTTKRIVQQIKQAAEQLKVQAPKAPKLSAPKSVPTVKLPQISPILTARVI